MRISRAALVGVLLCVGVLSGVGGFSVARRVDPAPQPAAISAVALPASPTPSPTPTPEPTATPGPRGGGSGSGRRGGSGGGGGPSCPAGCTCDVRPAGIIYQCGGN